MTNCEPGGHHETTKYGTTTTTTKCIDDKMEQSTASVKHEEYTLRDNNTVSL
jgi:hypothetical protein